MNPNESKNFYFACSDDFGLVSYMFQLLYFGFDAVGKEFLRFFLNVLSSAALLSVNWAGVYQCADCTR